MTAVAPPIGPYSRPHRRRLLDGRTTVGRHVRAFEIALRAHVGAAPSLPILALVDQAVGIELQIALFEEAGVKTDHDRRTYFALLNAKRLTLREIGLTPAPSRTPTLEEHLAALAAERDDEAAA